MLFDQRFVMKFIALLLSLAVASAQTPPAKKPGSVEGVVTNSVTNEPVKKAIVSLQSASSQSNYSGITDVAGNFKFENVPPGVYQTWPSRDGFMFQQPGVPAINKPFKVDEEQHVKNLSLKLIPLGVVSGHVFDEDGDPIAGVIIQAAHNVYSQGGRQLNAAGGATTNDLGEFQLINLQPGRYYFQANAAVRAISTAGVRPARREETYPPTYYPSAGEAQHGTAVEVAAGAEITAIDFRLRKIPSYRLRGKIVDAQGQSSANVSLHILRRESSLRSMVPFVRVQPDGTFDVRAMVPGSYMVIAQRSEVEKVYAARQTINVSDDDVNGVLLTLTPPLEISGSIQVEGTQPQGQQPSQVILYPVDEDGEGASALPETDGTFTLKNVAPNVCQLVMHPGPGTYLKTIRLGDQDHPDARIDLTQQSGGLLRLVLGTDGGKLDGTVQDQNGDPATGALITVVPGGEFEKRIDLFKQSISDEKGNFSFQDLAPSEYKVFAWQNADRNAVQSTEFRTPFESKAASVSIAANGHESVQLKLISTDDIEKEKSRLR